MSICQTKKTQTGRVFAFFLMMQAFGCSSTQVVQDNSWRKIKPTWGNVDQRFYMKDEKGIPDTHLFFDVDPQIKKLTFDHKTNLPINYIVTGNKDDEYQYNVDLYSGKLFRDKLYCPRNDVWQSYSGDVAAPNFTQGFIPRVFDQQKNPLQVMIASSGSFKREFSKDPKHFEQTRIIGSLLVEECENYPCDFKDKWKTQQVLLGVDSGDKSYENILTLSDFRNKLNWKYTRAFVENRNGVHLMGSKAYPKTRITAELNLADTFKYLQDKSIIFDQKKMGSLIDWRKNCMSLYDDLWEKTQKIRGQKSNQDDDFLKLFREFYKTKNEDFHACSKIVRPSNILEDKHRHWFFAYIQGFDLLVKNGHYFSCANASWIYNPRNADGSFYVNQVKELERCSAKKLEIAFEYVVNGFHLMKNSTNQTFRYVEYDNKKGGSHQLLYSWIHDKSGNLNCKYKNDEKTQMSLEIFPQDVVWEIFKQDQSNLIR